MGVWGAQGWVGVVFGIGGWGIWGRVGRSGWGVRGGFGGRGGARGGGVRGGGGGGGAAFLVSTFMCFLTVFAKLYLERGTAHHAMSPPKFEIFLIFLYFLGNQAFYTRYHVSFYL